MPPDGAERMRAALEEAEEVRPEPPRPLTRDMPPANRFPIEALGDVLAPAAHAINDRVQPPIAMCDQSVIAVAALATQGHASVRLPIGLKITDIPVCTSHGRTWASLPSKPILDRDRRHVEEGGKKKYAVILQWGDRATADRWSDAFVDLVHQQHPGMLDQALDGVHRAARKRNLYAPAVGR